MFCELHRIHEEDKQRHNEEMNFMSQTCYDLGNRICAMHLHNYNKKEKKKNAKENKEEENKVLKKDIVESEV